MSKVWIPIVLFLSGALLVALDAFHHRPAEHEREGCMLCHALTTDPDPSHPVSAFACSACHLGNAYSANKERAHFTMVRNPGDLRVADRTCGKAGCHPEILDRVGKSIMATNKGILRTLQAQWLGIEHAATEVKDLLGEARPANPAIDHYRKMCGGCHLWKERGDRPGEAGRRGGGCSDCHVLDEPRDKPAGDHRLVHPRMTTRIPSENCVKCHNRSARIGLSYFGRFESAGYGTPHEAGRLSPRRLSGNRFFMELPADVHFVKAGMACIDCHTATGVMGDGNAYDRMGLQADITCGACHAPEFSVPREEKGDLARRLVLLNRKVPELGAGPVGRTRKGTPLYNLRWEGGKVRFYRKGDGRALDMDIPAPRKPHHRLSGHERLTCQACHTAWIPQCYGCHIANQPWELQRDWISGRAEPGAWRETRSHIRFSSPALGVKSSDRISPVAPCQVFVSFFDASGAFLPDRSIRTLTMSAFDPHTTQARSRTCAECHADPAAVGLGDGVLRRSGGSWEFRPTYDAEGSGLGISFPLDAYVRIDGTPLQTDSREGVRPFRKEEIDRILGVGICLGCHETYEDPVYRDFRASRERFGSDLGLPCRR